MTTSGFSTTPVRKDDHGRLRGRGEDAGPDHQVGGPPLGCPVQGGPEDHAADQRELWDGAPGEDRHAGDDGGYKGGEDGPYCQWNPGLFSLRK